MGFLDIIASGIFQVLSMFAQLIEYFISAPGQVWNEIMTNWGSSFENYGLMIPIIFVIVLGITGAIAYTLIEMGDSVNDAMNEETMGSSLSIIAFLMPIHVISLDEFSYILNTIGNAIVQGLVSIINALVQGIDGLLSGIISGFENAIGIPFSYWSSNLNQGYIIPIIFVTILGIALLLGIFWIDIMGFEQDAGESIMDLEKL